MASASAEGALREVAEMLRVTGINYPGHQAAECIQQAIDASCTQRDAEIERLTKERAYWLGEAMAARRNADEAALSTVPNLQSEIERLRGELAAAMETLAWYADRRNWLVRWVGDDLAAARLHCGDGGKRARDFFAKLAAEAHDG